MRPPRTNSSFDTTTPVTLPPDTSPHTLTIGILPTESFFHLPPLRSPPLCKKRQLASSVTHNSRSPTRSEKPTHQTTDLKPGDWSTVCGDACSAIPSQRTTVRGFRNSSDNSTFTIHHSQFRFTLPILPCPFIPVPRYPSLPTRFTFHASRLTPYASRVPLHPLPLYPFCPLPLYPYGLPPYPRPPAFDLQKCS